MGVVYQPSQTIADRLLAREAPRPKVRACLHLCSDLMVYLKISFPCRKLGNGEQHEERRQNSPVISELVLLCPGPSKPLQNEKEGSAVPHAFLLWAL